MMGSARPLIVTMSTTRISGTPPARRRPSQEQRAQRRTQRQLEGELEAALRLARAQLHLHRAQRLDDARGSRHRHRADEQRELDAA